MAAQLIYSTSTSNNNCPKCNKELRKCKCSQSTVSTPSKEGVIRVGRETKGKKGKGISTITGLPLDEYDLKELAKKLKAKCGCGGTVKNGIIEIQGDHRDLLVKELSEKGYKAKKSGG
jgi:translation initiation factor 1